MVRAQDYKPGVGGSNPPSLPIKSTLINFHTPKNILWSQIDRSQNIIILICKLSPSFLMLSIVLLLIAGLGSDLNKPILHSDINFNKNDTKITIKIIFNPLEEDFFHS